MRGKRKKANVQNSQIGQLLGEHWRFSNAHPGVGEHKQINERLLCSHTWDRSAGVWYSSCYSVVVAWISYSAGTVKWFDAWSSGAWGGTQWFRWADSAADGERWSVWPKCFVAAASAGKGTRAADFVAGLPVTLLIESLFYPIRLITRVISLSSLSHFYFY